MHALVLGVFSCKHAFMHLCVCVCVCLCGAGASYEITRVVACLQNLCFYKSAFVNIENQYVYYFVFAFRVL